jgi:hypothetical protein
MSVRAVFIGLGNRSECIAEKDLARAMQWARKAGIRLPVGRSGEQSMARPQGVENAWHR